MNKKHIPPHAKCVFKGEIFNVYQWPQQMFDGSVETFEAITRPETTTVIATGKNEHGENIIYYSKQEQPAKEPFIGLFGGRMEEGETPEESAKRELLEEAGLASDNWELLHTTSFGGKINWDIHLFIAHNCKKIAEQKLDAGEKIEVLSATYNEFMKIIHHPNFVEQNLTNMLTTSELDQEKAKNLKLKLNF